MTYSNNLSMEAVFSKAENNFPRHLLAASRHMHSTLMSYLINDYGFKDLRLSFHPYMMLARNGTSVANVADSLDITRQAANAAISELETLGYLARQDDPRGGRSKKITLSARGRRLIRLGDELVEQIRTTYLQIVGEQKLLETCATAAKLLTQLTNTSPAMLPSDSDAPSTSALFVLLPRLSDFVSLELMKLTAAKGHPKLKLSFGQVVPLIGPYGGRMKTMATLHMVSKQAINKIANELKQLGYIEMRPDSYDARQVHLHLTPAGERLVRDSLVAVDELETMLKKAVGKQALESIKDTLSQLYASLRPELDFERESLRQMATELRSTLGADRASQLAKLLLET